jgi:two-component sensor histidine kinase
MRSTSSDTELAQRDPDTILTKPCPTANDLVASRLRVIVSEGEEIMGRPAELPAAIAQVFTTDELLVRPAPAPDYLSEKLALQDLAGNMADHPADVLPRLVGLSMEVCDADSAGVSVLDGDVFRWNSLVGKLSAFEGVTTPRNFSPCGVCLDQSSPILMERPERAYSWIAEANITVPEVLLVPLLRNGTIPVGTLWVVAKEGHKFHSGHARVLSELAVFTGIALQMIHADLRLKKALEAQEILAKEMSHRLKNLFAVTGAMIKMTAQHAETKEEMTEALTGRLTALSDAHSLVRRSFNAGNALKGVDMAEAIRTVLRPYTMPDLNGPMVSLGERSTNSIALVFHELATNAAKYGALRDDGKVAVAWQIENENVDIVWREIGKAVEAPAQLGFGSNLVASTIASHNGRIDYDWSQNGLVIKLQIPLANLVN